MGAVERVPEAGDIRIENHGSIYLLIAVTPRAENWLREHTDAEAMWVGSRTQSGLVVEPRYVEEIVNGAKADGLEVR